MSDRGRRAEGRLDAIDQAWLIDDQVLLVVGDRIEVRSWPDWSLRPAAATQPPSPPPLHVDGLVLRRFRPVAGPGGEVAVLASEDVHPPWQRLLFSVRSGPTRVVARRARIHAAPAFLSDGSLAATVFSGCRLVIVRIDPATDALHPLIDVPDVSVRLLAVLDDHTFLAVRSRVDGDRALVAITATNERVIEQGGTARGRGSLHRWQTPDGPLEGVLLEPSGAPRGVVVYLHGGPLNALVCGEHTDMSTWLDAGLAVFLPEYRGSGILGEHLAFSSDDAEVEDVLSGLRSLRASRPDLPTQTLLAGFSYGALLAARVLTHTDVFDGALIIEAMLTALHDDDSWYLDRRRVPADTSVHLVYGGGHTLAPHAERWSHGLASHGATVDCSVYPEQPHWLTGEGWQRAQALLLTHV